MLDAGGAIEVIGIKKGEAQAYNKDLEPGDTFTVDKSFDEVSPADYDALIVPGDTVGSDKLRGHDAAVRFVRGFFEQAKPVSVICHGPWLLVEADVVAGRRLTSYPTLETDIRNAGGDWVNQEVVVDAGLVTSRKPDDMDAFCAKLVEEFAEGEHEAQARSVAGSRYGASSKLSPSSSARVHGWRTSAPSPKKHVSCAQPVSGERKYVAERWAGEGDGPYSGRCRRMPARRPVREPGR